MWDSRQFFLFSRVAKKTQTLRKSSAQMSKGRLANICETKSELSLKEPEWWSLFPAAFTIYKRVVRKKYQFTLLEWNAAMTNILVRTIFNNLSPLLEEESKRENCM